VDDHPKPAHLVVSNCLARTASTADARCGTLLQMRHAAWSVCLYVENTQCYISQAAEKCVPCNRPRSTRCKKKRKRVPYWDDNFRNAVYSRNRARNKMNKNCTPENVKEYRRLKGIAQRVIKDAASRHWENFCRKQ